MRRHCSIENPPGGGDAHPPRGAVEKPSAEPLLELQYVLAGCRAGQAKPFGRRGKAAGFDNGGENLSVLKTIH